MGPSTSPEVQIEYVHHRRRRWQVAGVLGAFALMLGVLALFGVAYALQSDRVDELEAQNESILDDHHAIGAKFAEQSKRFAKESRKLEGAIRSSYGQGFLAGQQAVRLPVELRSLARYAAAGMLVPRRLPTGASESRARVERDLDGYTIRWRRIALFASRTEPLSDWTRQALGGLRRVRLGPHRVQRLLGPSGVIFAWRKRGATYAVLAFPTQEPAARALIASMR
jgi:hypothetical protein